MAMMMPFLQMMTQFMNNSQVQNPAAAPVKATKGGKPMEAFAGKAFTPPLAAATVVAPVLPRQVTA